MKKVLYVLLLAITTIGCNADADTPENQDNDPINSFSETTLIDNSPYLIYDVEVLEVRQNDFNLSDSEIRSESQDEYVGIEFRFYPNGEGEAGPPGELFPFDYVVDGDIITFTVENQTTQFYDCALEDDELTFSLDQFREENNQILDYTGRFYAN